MNTQFLDFWRLYAPLKEFSNRYLACKRLWESMDEASCEGILKELERQRGTLYKRTTYPKGMSSRRG